MQEKLQGMPCRAESGPGWLGSSDAGSRYWRLPVCGVVEPPEVLLLLARALRTWARRGRRCKPARAKLRPTSPASKKQLTHRLRGRQTGRRRCRRSRRHPWQREVPPLLRLKGDRGLGALRTVQAAWDELAGSKQAREATRVLHGCAFTPRPCFVPCCAATTSFWLPLRLYHASRSGRAWLDTAWAERAEAPARAEGSRRRWFVFDAAIHPIKPCLSRYLPTLQRDNTVLQHSLPFCDAHARQ
jgi:hypothetical protein